MMTVSELTSGRIAPQPRTTHAERVELFTSSLDAGLGTVPARFEKMVFNFLLSNKAALGIKSVFKFKNLKVDGAVELTNKKRFVLEIKYKMNWAKACQSESQFRRFLTVTKEGTTNRVDGAIVIFEEFSGDWVRRAHSRARVDGWDRWYNGHCEAESKPMYLLRLCKGELKGYPSID